MYFRNKLYILAVFIGIVAGYGAIAFRALIGFFQNLFFHLNIDYNLTSPLTNKLGYWIILVPTIGIPLAFLIVKRFAIEAKGHGVPEVIEAVLSKAGIIRKRVVLVKALASAITIASGGSVGREGPIVQIGSAFGSTIGRLFKFSPHLNKTLIGCGAAGAIAATFNTPIAGVIFAIELIVLEMKASSFIPLVISSVFATVISRWHIGDEPAFFVPVYKLVHPTELILYLGLGMLAGVIGFIVIRTLYGTEDFFDKVKLNPLLKSVIGGFIVGVVGYYFPQIFGVGYETVDSVLHQDLTIYLMFGLVFIKIFAMSVTMAAGGSGGIFAPSLFIGAMLGGSYGSLMHSLFPSITAGYGAYALVGMAAVFSATSRATFTAIVILFEMTLDYSIIVPLMFVCVVADQVSLWLCKDDTIYSVKLKRKGVICIPDGFGANIYEMTRISDIMCEHIVTIDYDATLAAAQDIVHNTSHSVYPIVDKSGVLKGLLHAKNILEKAKQHGGNGHISKYVHAKPKVVWPSETVYSTFKKFKRERDPRICVVDPLSNKLIGIVTPADILKLNEDF